MEGEASRAKGSWGQQMHLTQKSRFLGKTTPDQAGPNRNFAYRNASLDVLLGVCLGSFWGPREPAYPLIAGVTSWACFV